MDNKANAGQPTKYNVKYCKMIIDFFSIKPTEIIELNGKKHIQVADFPTMAGFAVSIGVHRETLINWCKANSEFFDAYKLAKDYQERILVINGLNGNYNSNFSKFVATNITRFKDIKQIDATNLNMNIDSEQDDDKSLDESISEFIKLKERYDNR